MRPARRPRGMHRCMTTTKGALFDFSGTLFRVESVESWLRTVLDRYGTTMEAGAFARCAGRLAAAGALPGGPPPRTVPPGLAELWATRDESAERHRAAYIGLARQVSLPRPELYDALYARHMEPEAWRPYPDAAQVLGELRRRGVAIAVVSNIGWDLRPVFRAHDMERLVDAFVLSYEHGMQKPDPRLFLTACEALRVEPAEALMVGDDRRADTGAAQLGCEVYLVDPLPLDQRPRALRPVLDLAGGAGAA